MRRLIESGTQVNFSTGVARSQVASIDWRARRCCRPIAAAFEPGEPELGWLTQSGRVPLGYLV